MAQAYQRCILAQYQSLYVFITQIDIVMTIKPQYIVQP